MNKYRFVKYTDDGCDMHQCLNCKTHWEGRYVSTNFCSWCGIEFDGKHDCRPHNQPQWHYKLYGNWNNNYDLPPAYKEIEDWRQVWKIEHCIWSHYNDPNALPYWSSDTYVGSAKQLFRYLQNFYWTELYFGEIYRISKGGRQILLYKSGEH